MNREITTHHGNMLNHLLQLNSFGPPGNGGAHWRYTVIVNGQVETFQFQQGNPTESINGISDEVLLAIVRDRLEGFQKGPFACCENHEALGHVIFAMKWLLKRTESRNSRGVEGTQQP